MPNIRADQLKSLTRAIFSRKGASDENAETVSDLLVKANLAGHDSHGVIRIMPYVKEIDEGKLNPKAKGVLEVDDGAMGLINGNAGFGQVVATQAMRMAIEKGKKFGVSAFCIYNCGHIGRMADYSLMAMKEDMIGITMVNSYPSVAPFGGIERMFNPSPLGAAVPTGDKQHPFSLDICMSVCAVGKIAVKKARGEKLPEGWIVDKNGAPSVEPDDFFNGGSILPIGGNVGYKGYGLAFLVDILSGALSGNGSASSKGVSMLKAKGFSGGNGVFMLTIDISRFGPVAAFKRRLDETISRVRMSKKAPGVKEILIPGEPELIEEQKRLKNGIFIEDATWDEITSIARTLHVNVPRPMGLKPVQ